LKKSTSITESQFYMWRTLFAISHADQSVSAEEVRFMAEAMEDMPFSPEQKAILSEDINHPKKIGDMFKGITDELDQARFFQFARDMVWADGSFGLDEQKIMLELSKVHVRNVEIQNLVGKIDLQFESEDDTPTVKTPGRKTTKDIAFRFRDLFFKK
jgi:hypothetical protein